MRKVSVLIASRSREAAQHAAELLAEHPQCSAEIRILSNGHVDPLHDRTAMPDLLLLCDLQAEDELRSLSEMPADKRPALIVFGSGQNTESIRLALRAGAQDYLSLPLNRDELYGILAKLLENLKSKPDGESGNLHVFINGKGGAGASFLATNVAHGLVSNGMNVTLVDLDLQFAGLCRYLDLTPKRDLIDALLAVDEMDNISAAAFTSEHESGLRLLSRLPDNKLQLNVDVMPERLVALLRTYQSFNDFVVVDLPRHIDTVSAAVLEHASHISVVMQQSFPHLHDTARLLNILRHELGIDNSRLSVVVNRFDKGSPIMLADIEKALRFDALITIPNHYASTAESINSGIPLTDITRRSAVSKGLSEYIRMIAPAAAETQSTGAFQRLFRRS